MFTLRISLAAMMVCILGCDGDDDARPRYRANVTPAIGNTTQVSMLEDDELQRVCRSYDAYVETHVSFEAIAYVACLPTAIVLSASPEGCERRLDDCMALFPDPITVSVETGDTRICVDSLRECNASIAEFEGCVNVSLDLALDIVDNWTCRGIDDDRRAEAARAMDTVSVCAQVDDPCAQAVAFGPD